VQALSPRRIDSCDHVVHLVPVRAAGSLEVIDLDGNLRSPCNVDGLVDRLEQAIAFAAHVRDV
jgi:hypothetical protein